VVTPVVHVPKIEGGNGSEGVETITVTQGGMMVGQEGQVLQVLSLKDAQHRNSSNSSPPHNNIKEEDVVVVNPCSSPEN
jgi:hypothetical protein